MVLVRTGTSTYYKRYDMGGKSQTVASHMHTWAHRPVSTTLLGLVTGGTHNLFGLGTLGEASSCLLQAYAEQHLYALYVERNMTHWALDRTAAWGKLRLLQYLLYSHPKLPIVAWIDMDIVITDLSVPLLDRLLHMPNCTHGLLGDSVESSLATGSAFNNQTQWANRLAATGESSIFWVGRDVNERYALNVNTGMFALRNSKLALEFLNAAWSFGDDPNHFKRHDFNWMAKSSDDPYYGWPFEQGGMWDAWTASPRLLQQLCVAEPGHLQLLLLQSKMPEFKRILCGRDPQDTSLRDAFAVHMVGLSSAKRLQGVQWAARHAGQQQCLSSGAAAGGTVSEHPRECSPAAALLFVGNVDDVCDRNPTTGEQPGLEAIRQQAMLCRDRFMLCDVFLAARTSQNMNNVATASGYAGGDVLLENSRKLLNVSSSSLCLQQLRERVRFDVHLLTDDAKLDGHVHSSSTTLHATAASSSVTANERPFDSAALSSMRVHAQHVVGALTSAIRYAQGNSTSLWSYAYDAIVHVRIDNIARLSHGRYDLFLTGNGYESYPESPCTRATVLLNRLRASPTRCSGGTRSEIERHLW